MPRVYATAADLENYLGINTAPLDAQRLLTRASESVDDALLAAVYPTDASGYPTILAHREAVRDAACAIVEWWSEDTGTGDETGAQGVWQSASAGAVSLSRGGSTGSGGVTNSTTVRPGYLPPRAYGYLHRAGLLPGTVFQR